MAATTLGVNKLTRFSGNCNSLRSTGTNFLTFAALSSAGSTFMVSKDGQGIDDASLLFLLIDPTTGNNADATSRGIELIARAATAGATVFPTGAWQGDKKITVVGVSSATAPNPANGSTHSFNFVGPFESARFLSTRGGKLGYVFHIKGTSSGAAKNAKAKVAAVALPGAYSTYGA